MKIQLKKEHGNSARMSHGDHEETRDNQPFEVSPEEWEKIYKPTGLFELQGDIPRTPLNRGDVPALGEVSDEPAIAGFSAAKEDADSTKKQKEAR